MAAFGYENMVYCSLCNALFNKGSDHKCEFNTKGKKPMTAIIKSTDLKQLPDGIYYSRFPKDCPTDRHGRADRNGKWPTPIGIVVVNNTRAGDPK